MDKRLVMLGMVIGSTAGGYLPTIFGVSAFSWSSILCGVAGGFLGIWAAVKLMN